MAIPSAGPSLKAAGQTSSCERGLRGLLNAPPHHLRCSIPRTAPELLPALRIGRGLRGDARGFPPTVIEGRAREVRAGCAAQPRVPVGWNPARCQGRAGGCGQTLLGSLRALTPGCTRTAPSAHPGATKITPPPLPPALPDAERIAVVRSREQLRTTAAAWSRSGPPEQRAHSQTHRGAPGFWGVGRLHPLMERDGEPWGGGLCCTAMVLESEVPYCWEDGDGGDVAQSRSCLGDAGAAQPPTPPGAAPMGAPKHVPVLAVSRGCAEQSRGLECDLGSSSLASGSGGFSSFLSFFPPLPPFLLNNGKYNESA